MNIEGQMTIFDFLDNSDDFETMSIERAVELIENATGLKFSLDERHFKNHYSANKKGFYIQIGFSHFAKGVFDGARFLDVQIDKNKWGAGNPTTSIEEVINFINRQLSYCEHSKHTCNKKELFKIAETLDDIICPHVCCRFCNTKACGARCNGSEEPKSRKEVIVKGFMDDGYCPSCDGCLDDLVDKCQYCGQLVSWNNWKEINKR